MIEQQQKLVLSPYMEIYELVDSKRQPASSDKRTG